MSPSQDSHSPEELLESAELLFSSSNPKMFRAAILEAITALEAYVRDKVFAVLQEKVGAQLAEWIEEKTRMDFDSRLSVLVPVATDLAVDKNSDLWRDYKKARDIRKKVAHSGVKVSSSDARFVIDTVYEWIEYLSSAQQARARRKEGEAYELIGRFLEASARLERVIYSAVTKSGRQALYNRVLGVRELEALNLVSPKIIVELKEFRDIRNHIVHGTKGDYKLIDEQKVKRLNAIVDEIEAQLK